MSVKAPKSGILVALSVHNEETLLPFFLRHYSFADKIIVWDNESTDRTPEIAVAHPLVDLRHFKTKAYDEISVLDRLHQSIREAEGIYRWCLLPDCDEFIVQENSLQIQDELQNLEEFDVIIPCGFNMIKHTGEGPLSMDSPLVGQRRYGYAARDYNKPIIIRPNHKLSFAAGKHELKTTPRNARVTRNSRLILLHHDMVDYDLWVYRKTKRPLSAHNIAKGWCVKRFCRESNFYENFWNEESSKAKPLALRLPVLMKQ